ncbi:MAG: CTP synthase, partial [Cyclobacteriaceae bacterium]|nr:CTP synthase [Cyclobacteriaceae bacterium]
DLEDWKAFLSKLKNPTEEVNIGLIGKYVELPDAYKSIAESFIHAGAANECRVNLKWIHSETINEKTLESTFRKLDGVLVAPGFGERGIEGKILAAEYARVNNIPFFGICLGMQCAAIEFARNVLKLKGAASTEVNEKTKYPIIDLMDEQKKITDKGGTMRLGAYPCQIKKGSKVSHIYNATKITERHRHRYEFNNAFLEEFEKNGMQAAGINPETGLVEIIELKDHPWFIGTQFHPELKSTVLSPHPLFVSFVKAAINNKKI